MEKVNIEKYIGQVVTSIVSYDAYKATKFVAANMVVSACRRCVTKTSLEVVVKIGRPNYAQKEFIKKAKKAGESFPVKKIQLTFKKKKNGNSRKK